MKRAFGHRGTETQRNEVEEVEEGEEVEDFEASAARLLWRGRRERGTFSRGTL